MQNLQRELLQTSITNRGGSPAPNGWKTQRAGSWSTYGTTLGSRGPCRSPRRQREWYIRPDDLPGSRIAANLRSPRDDRGSSKEIGPQ
jgi:hypothetical protein